MTIDRREFLKRAATLGIVVTTPVLEACADHPAASDAGDGGPDSTPDAADAADGGVDAVPDTAADADADTLPDDGLPRYEHDGEPGPETTFEHGVASGDPLTDAVLLWTRVSPAESTGASLPVFLEVSETPTFERRVSADWFETSAASDHTLRVDATGLQPGTTYYYRFSALGRTSPIGRTKTAPTGGVEHVNFAVCSCSNYAFGYFHAYHHMAKRPDLDAFIHLGDYIYEYANEGFGDTYGTLRELDPPHEMVTLDDYRRRYAHYRRDEDLQELHRQNPMIHIWDDHEFTNDPYIGGAQNHEPDEEGSWDERVEAALQAYAEWMPTRLADGGRIYRELVFGDLVHLALVDRQRRFIWPSDDDGDLYLGAEQHAWLEQTIAGVSAQWFVLGVGTTYGPHDASMVGGSSWNAASRERVHTALAAAGVEDFVVLTGDIHRAEALDIVADRGAYDPDTGAGSAGVELSSNSITSPGSTRPTAGIPQYKWSDGLYRGYLVVDFTPERMKADFYGFFDLLKTYESPPAEQRTIGFVCAAGTRFLVESDEEVPTRDAPELAP